MIILPAIDIKDGKCVRLYRGDYSTAEIVAKDAVETAKDFQSKGARWLHMVDLDGAKSKKPENADIVFDVRKATDMNIEIGGGIRDMDTIGFYLSRGINRVILGSAALHTPNLVKEAIDKYGKRIAVGIDALNGKVAAEGWTDTSDVDYIELAKTVESFGCEYIIFTDISKDGTLAGPNLEMLKKIDEAVSCNIIASGGISSIEDIEAVHKLNLYGVIAGKAIYSNKLDLEDAVILGQNLESAYTDDDLERYFQKSELVPAIVQDNSTNEVLMLAYMNKESLRKTIETNRTWFYSRSRKSLWNKGETSGHYQEVVSISVDCDDDTLLIKVNQIGVACHTGRHSCFYKEIKD